jgi:hypothetical protein
MSADFLVQLQQCGAFLITEDDTKFVTHAQCPLVGRVPPDFQHESPAVKTDLDSGSCSVRLSAADVLPKPEGR